MSWEEEDAEIGHCLHILLLLYYHTKQVWEHLDWSWSWTNFEIEADKVKWSRPSGPKYKIKIFYLHFKVIDPREQLNTIISSCFPRHHLHFPLSCVQPQQGWATSNHYPAFQAVVHPPLPPHTSYCWSVNQSQGGHRQTAVEEPKHKRGCTFLKTSHTWHLDETPHHFAVTELLELWPKFFFFLSHSFDSNFGEVL